ncbi:Variant surface glycoprotein [Trypanosoma congolense IL3000]|uniref:Variant surface glycoprotein n=1 Tax=Trypanosoma congolense (strain IL3000) TaxID=1068625 RepID=F9WBB2_TRYCI|nr:Variant surface glycoprotein [Trypanosoma congolense IL3000]
MKMWCGEWCSEGTKDHNKEAHHRLCRVLQEAVGKWGKGGTDLSEPLKEALKQTIFGYNSGETDVKRLGEELPNDYNDLERPLLSLRSLWCGQPRSEIQRRWPGHSAPHDLVCLCTAGKTGWPINETSHGATLCGKDSDSLGSSGNNGWDSSGKGKVKDQIEKTWEKVVKDCLQSVGQGNRLRETLDTFIAELNRTTSEGYGDLSRLGDGSFHSYHGCDGTPQLGVCALYYRDYKDTIPWWLQLENALEEDKKIQEKKKLEEEEKQRKQQEKANKQKEPRAEPVKSTQPITQDTAKNESDTLSEKLRKLNLTSGTPICPPSSWLLSAVFLF